MIEGIEVKVCGLTRACDAVDAAAMGADFLGFIFFPGSPRYLSVSAFEQIQADLPELPKVAVVVAPNFELIDSLTDLGFEYLQIHYAVDSTEAKTILDWSAHLGPERLWLAPKIPPEREFDESLVDAAGTWLWDTYKKDVFGGTGMTGDWNGFKRLSERHPAKVWTLSGGLGPSNVAEAVEETGAKRVDLSSSVEKSPGIKDQMKLDQVRLALENR